MAYHAENKFPVPGTDQITLENCNRGVFLELGRLIHSASLNDDDFQSLRRNIEAKLVGAGVLQSSIKNLQFYVVRDEPEQVHITVPEVKERTDFATSDLFEAYLVELGLVTIRACKR